MAQTAVLDPPTRAEDVVAAEAHIRDLRSLFGLTRSVFSRLLGCSERALASWEAGKQASERMRQRMIELERLYHGLAGTISIDPGSLGEWMQRPNAAFSGSTPAQVIERGELDRLWRMIYDLEAGEPG